MSVSVYFSDARATIPQGASFDEPVDFPNRLRVLDGGGKVIAVISVDAMQMAEIDSGESDDDAATPSAD